MNIKGIDIAKYLGENFNHLYRSDAGIIEFIAGSLPENISYLQILNEIITQPKPLFIDFNGIPLPLFYYESADHKITLADLTVKDLSINSFLLLSGWQEVVIKKRDLHERFPYSESLQSKFNFAGIPVVNFLFNEMCLRIKQSGYHCNPLKFSTAGSNIIFTHDIDRLYSGWYEATGHVIKNPWTGKLRSWVELSRRKLFFQVDDYQDACYRLLALLDKFQIKSVFFFLASRSRDDADYRLGDHFTVRFIKDLQEAGHIPGLHAGYHTFRDPGQLNRQIGQACNFLGENIINNRQHFLKFDLSFTPLTLFNAGIKYDFSLGFAEAPGFRNSIATPFYVFDFLHPESARLVEVPLFFMDGTYSHYQRIDKHGFRNPLEDIAQYSKYFNMNFSVLFHNSVFTDFKYQGFSQLFIDVAEFAAEQGFSADAHIRWPEM
ncbi:MAG TPA: hypothetical protein PLW31_00580 [Bacteroidales bacterium]|nr:hypothetical protein [Bacteroidales bacterium]HPM92175.1 hypothetical protein [Bacteroidales bacterium]